MSIHMSIQMLVSLVFFHICDHTVSNSSNDFVKPIALTRALAEWALISLVGSPTWIADPSGLDWATSAADFNHWIGNSQPIVPQSLNSVIGLRTDNL